MGQPRAFSDSARTPGGRLTALRQIIRANPLRLAVIVAMCWASGTVVITVMALVAQVQLSGWQGLVEASALIPAFGFAAASYLLRFLRWHFLARRVATDLRIWTSFIVDTIGFALIMTPGRTGEALKLVLLRQRTSVPVASSAPVWMMEKATEGAGLALLAVGASLFLPWLEGVRSERRFELVGILLFGLVVGVTFWRQIANLAPRLPLLGRVLRRPALAELWRNLVRGGDRVLSWPVLLTSLTLSVLARACDGVAIYWAASIYGVDLSLAASWFLIGTSGFLGGISMIPGGAGVAEATLVGLLTAFGAPPAAATATALTSRVLIFWQWVAVGLAFALRYALAPWPDRVDEAHS